MTIPKLKICEPVATPDDIEELRAMIEKLERRIEESEDEITQLKEQVANLQMILGGNRTI